MRRSCSQERCQAEVCFARNGRSGGDHASLTLLAPEAGKRFSALKAPRRIQLNIAILSHKARFAKSTCVRRRETTWEVGAPARVGMLFLEEGEACRVAVIELKMTPSSILQLPGHDTSRGARTGNGQVFGLGPAAGIAHSIKATGRTQAQTGTISPSSLRHARAWRKCRIDQAIVNACALAR